ncbi:MAG TPA: response regulator transcription factor [Candidatus Polarisedimenticolia bacterium]|nr:response regulator transcription factor [Candidatus Polarisedimenticolia bacterium]
MPKILIVEDDASMAAALKDGFESERFTVVLAQDGAAGLRLANEAQPDLILLDVMLPKMSGLDVCREIRKAGDGVPILMLTARRQEIDKVVGLKLGADDYVTKPFGFLELLARVEALLRRASGQAAPLETYRFGTLTADFKRGEVRKKGRLLDLSARELRLLQYFVAHRGTVVGRDQLLDAVWDYDAAPITRTVDVHVAKLRKKIEDRPAVPRFIVTVHGIGYKFTG